MRLIKRFTIVCVRATPHLIAAPEFHFYKPIRIRKRLTRHADNVSLSLAQDLFSLFKRRYPTRRYHRCVKASLIDSLLD